MDDWLRSVGLEHCIAAFQAERITRDQLPELTEDDLKALGLTIGERRRYRRAVMELLAPAAPPPQSATFAERRPLTMMFVDLVGSSELGELLEPEDLLEVVRVYRDFCGAAIRRFGGAVARQIGDGILAYFSYPVATENDPERAVRAALEIARDIVRVASPAPTPLRVRIGIATGRVIISDMLAGGAADLRTIIGSPPNFAARLQGMAGPGGIVIAEETHARLGGLFACEELPPVEVRGFSGARRAWRVLHEAQLPGWHGAPRTQRLTPFYARQSELAALAAHWTRAQQGHGSAVLVTGEAGIGKSRLIETFLALNCLEECRVLHLGASPLDIDSPLHPFVTWLRADAQAGPPGDLADLLGVRAPAAATPAQIREQILAALVARVHALADHAPLCFVVDDLHWLDPSSLELLGRLIATLGARRVLLLLTARDGFAASWPGGAAIATLALARLGAGDVAAMVQGQFEGARLPAPLIAQLVRKSDGVPLFVVELLRGLLQPDGMDMLGTLADEPAGEIPNLLQDLLMARLDRAGFAKEVAQVAAVIGRSIRPVMLADVAGRAAPDLEPALATLVASGVLIREGAGPVASYSFSHALLRDAAYDSLLRDHRQALHLQVADALPRHDPAAVQQQPELLALHLTEGGQAVSAAPHWVEAARRSLERSALMEAKRLLRRGLAALDKAEDAVDLADLRLEMMALLGPALIALSGPGAAETIGMYDTAWQHCQDRPENKSYFPIYWGWWRVSRNYIDMPQRANALLGRARLMADDGLVMQAHHCAWASCYCVGDLSETLGHIEAGLAIYHAGDYRDHARQYGNHDVKVCAHGELAEVYWQQGKPLQALAHERMALDWAAGMDHLGSVVHALDYGLMHRACRRDVAQVLAYADRLARLTDEHALADHHAKTLVFHGWVMAMRDDLAAGLRMMQDGIARQRDIGTHEDFPVYLSLLGELLIRAGRADEAVAALLAGRAQFAESGLKTVVPDMLRVLGDATLADNPAHHAQARAWFDESFELADRQGAALLSLRTAVSAARLDLRLGATPEGARRLARALAAMAEDDGSADRTEATRLLANYRRMGQLAPALA